MESNEAATSSAIKCGNCEKTDVSLKRCAKCKTTAYCNRECQKADWKKHKEECNRLAGSEAAGSQVPKRSNSKPFAAIYHKNFLHDRSETETFKILIDVLRMRQEDTYTFEGDTMNGTIYNGEPTSEKAFRQFLRKAKQVDGFLPPWWNGEKAGECVQYGLQSREFSLATAQENSDIQEAWGDNQMPMKLRMLGGEVYGNTPGTRGQDRGPMLQRMMAVEGGSMVGSTLDMSGLFR